MHSTEWSLVFFTTFSQLAAGIMVAVLLFVYAKKHKLHPRLNQTALYIAAGLMFIALILSFLHLNNPMHSIYAMSNIGSSWLSREILFVSLFLFSLVVVSLLPYVKPLKPKHYRTMTLGTALIGCMMVYAMSMLYIIPTVPAWNSISTLIAFFATALLLGSVFVLGLSLNFGQQVPQEQLWNKKNKVLFSCALIAIGIILINFFVLRPSVPEGNIGFPPKPISSLVHLLRWGTLILGVSSLFYVFFKQERLKQYSYLYYLPFVFLLISELTARAAFYAAYYRIGV
ncbi:MAG: DmsC/YnfH family molybdoenzyme membrane anchor subunit [Bacteroidales bacterium]